MGILNQLKDSFEYLIKTMFIQVQYKNSPTNLKGINTQIPMSTIIMGQ